MKRESLFLQVPLIILIVSSFAALDVQRVEASGTIYIRADGSIDPPTAPISTVDNVTYIFADNINDSLVVERNDVVVDGDGYTLQGTGVSESRGIDLSGRTNVTVKNLRIEMFETGIWLDSSSSNGVNGNNITNNENGIRLNSSLNNAVSGNNMTNSDRGITLYHCSNNSISGNNITGSNDGIFLSYSSNNNIRGNSVNDTDGIYLFRSPNYNSITENNITTGLARGDGITLESSPNNSISGNNITSPQANGAGILVWDSNSSISGNTFIGCGLVLWQKDSHPNTVIDNTVNGKPLVYLEGMTDYSVQDAGQVVLVECSRIRVEDLNLSHTYGGVQLLRTNNSLVSENNITGCGWCGISLSISSNNSLCGNNIANNLIGIELFSSSSNTVSRNNIANNCFGVIFSRVDLSFEKPFNNTLYHNTFIDNTENQVSFDHPCDPNIWDNGYPSGGNYWSDYDGTDADHDGIGDTAYSIGTNNTDNYPLMGMFSDFNATSDQHVTTICNSTISDFQFNGTAIMFDVTGGEETAGFCRICVPTSLMGTDRVFVNGTEVSYNLLPCSNSTHTYLYFNYTHSTQQVIIIPEFPSFLILPLASTAALLAAIVHRRRRH